MTEYNVSPEERARRAEHITRVNRARRGSTMDPEQRALIARELKKVWDALTPEQLEKRKAKMRAAWVRRKARAKKGGSDVTSPQ